MYVPMMHDKERIRQQLNLICNIIHKTVGLWNFLYFTMYNVLPNRRSTTLYSGEGEVMKSVTVQFVLSHRRVTLTCLLHKTAVPTVPRHFPCPTRHQLRECIIDHSARLYHVRNRQHYRTR